MTGENPLAFCNGQAMTYSAVLPFSINQVLKPFGIGGAYDKNIGIATAARRAAPEVIEPVTEDGATRSQDGIGGGGPITPPLRGSRSSRAARRWPMRWGANQRVAARLQHIPTGVGVSLFRVFVGRRSVSFPPTGSRAALAARSDRLGLRGRPTRRAVCPQSQPRTGSCPSHGSELGHGSTAGAEVTYRGEIATDRIAALLELNQGGGDGHGNSPYLPTNTNADIHAITLPLCPTPLALQICRAPGIG